MAEFVSVAARPRDHAEYYTLALELQRCDISDVVAWADSVIEESAEATDWAIDLAFCKNEPIDTVLSLLRKVPGQITDDLPRKMVSATLREDWLSGRLSDEQFINQWYWLYPEYPMEGDVARHAAEIWQYLDNVFLCLFTCDKIPITLDEARIQLKRLLEPYARYPPLVRTSKV